MKCNSLLVLIVSAAIGFPALAADDSPTLRYGWQAGQAYAYRVEIQAAKKDETEILSGMPLFAVKSVNKDNVVLQVSGERLASRREAKPGAIPSRPRITAIGRHGFGAVSGHEITLDLRGRVVKESGSASLPYLLGSRRMNVAQTLENWATDKEIPALIKMLDDNFQPTANAAIQALARLQAPEAIEPLVKQLEKQSARLVAGKACG